MQKMGGQVMGDILKSISSFVIGIAIFLGIVFLTIFFIKGGVWLGVKVLPWLSVIMWLVLALDIFGHFALG